MAIRIVTLFKKYTAGYNTDLLYFFIPLKNVPNLTSAVFLSNYLIGAPIPITNDMIMNTVTIRINIDDSIDEIV